MHLKPGTAIRSSWESVAVRRCSGMWRVTPLLHSGTCGLTVCWEGSRQMEACCKVCSKCYIKLTLGYDSKEYPSTFRIYKSNLGVPSTINPIKKKIKFDLRLYLICKTVNYILFFASHRKIIKLCIILALTGYFKEHIF